MKPTHPGVLAGLFAVMALLSWLVIGGVYSNLPQLPWTIVPPLVLLAAVEAYIGRQTKVQLRRRRGGDEPEPDPYQRQFSMFERWLARPRTPLAMARLVALAKASAYGAAMIAGIFAGMLAFLLPGLEKEAYAGDAVWAGASCVAALLLLGAALYLEHACRVPED